MNVLRVFVLFFALALAASRADNTNALPTKITIAGETYEDVTWGTVTPSTVSIRHKTGIASVLLEQLQPELQQRFGYDPVRAADDRAAQQRAEATSQKALRQRHAQEAAESQRQAKEQAEKQKQAAEDAAVAKKAADAEDAKYGPMTKLTFTYASKITPLRDGMYSANLWYSDDVGDVRNLFVTFPAAGLTYIRSVRNSSAVPNSSVVYGRPYEASLVNAFGAPVSDTAYLLVGYRPVLRGGSSYPSW